MTVLKFFLLILTVISSSLYWSCGTKSKSESDLQKYYTHLKPEEGVKVYHFASTVDSSLSGEFWRIYADNPGTISYAIYNEAGELLQWYRERGVGTGIIMEEYSLAGKDSSGAFTPVRAVIRYDDVLPFEAVKGGIFLFRMQWQGIGRDNMGYELIRNRIFSGDTTVQYQGKAVPAITFRLKDRVETEKTGILGLDISGEEVYAAGLGLIYYIRHLSNNRIMAYHLKEILSPDQVKQKFGLTLYDPFVKYPKG